MNANKNVQLQIKKSLFIGKSNKNHDSRKSKPQINIKNRKSTIESIYRKHRRRASLEKKVSFELLSKIIGETFSNPSCPVKIYTGYDLPDFSIGTEGEDIINIFCNYKEDDDFPELNVSYSAIGSDFYDNISDYFGKKFGQEIRIEHQNVGLMVTVKFLNDEIGNFFPIELEQFDRFVREDSLMALHFLHSITMLKHLYACFDFGLGSIDYEDTTMIDEEIETMVSDTWGDEYETDENESDADRENKIIDLYEEYERDYYGFPYHYGKFLSVVQDYDFDYERFDEVFKDIDYEYKNFFKLLREISAVEKLDVIAETFFSDLRGVKAIDEACENYFLVCYKRDWTQFCTMTSLEDVFNDMQTKFEECETSGVGLNIFFDPSVPFPENKINQFIQIAKKSEYYRLYNEIVNELTRIYENEEPPFSNPIIENYCKENNISIFSWLIPRCADRGSGNIQNWKSFRDLDIEYPGNKRTWPFNDKLDEAEGNGEI